MRKKMRLKKVWTVSPGPGGRGDRLFSSPSIFYSPYDGSPLCCRNSTAFLLSCRNTASSFCVSLGLVILATCASSPRKALPLQAPKRSCKPSTTVGLGEIGSSSPTARRKATHEQARNSVANCCRVLFSCNRCGLLENTGWVSSGILFGLFVRFGDSGYEKHKQA